MNRSFEMRRLQWTRIDSINSDLLGNNRGIEPSPQSRGINEVCQMMANGTGGCPIILAANEFHS